MVEHQQVSSAGELTRVREALVLSASDYPLAELSRKSIVLNLWAVTAKKNRERGREDARRKGLHLSSLPQARSGSINSLVFKRNDTLEPHRCHLSLEAVGCDEWCSFLRDLFWTPYPHPSLPGLIGCNPSPSQRPLIQTFVI